ncbi:MAG: DNA translocase FtsK 4TM domain-containing protein, partial [Nitrospira sp.]|nr:DNA translocase FtsK 4TM domain-containing protein [Nitrospira sp.]
MARQVANESPLNRGRRDWIGLVLVAIAMVWLLSLLSYDRLDLRANTARPNDPAHNWIGPIGAWWADVSFFGFGASAFLLPLGVLLYGLGCLAEAFAFARRRWIWLLLLVVVSAAFFDLNGRWIGQFLGGDLAGGLLGNLLNQYLFRFIGFAGSMAAFVLLYLLSLLGLSDFQLFDWIRDWWQRRRAAAEAALDEEMRLQKKAQQLEKEARRLQEMVDRERSSPEKPAKGGGVLSVSADELRTPTAPQGVGPDLKPVPEPTVRDLSVPQTKPASAAGKSTKASPAPEPPEDLEGEVITANEIAAAPNSPVAAKHDARKAPDDAKAAPDDVDDEEPTLPVPVRGRLVNPRRKLAVASAPAIGNYQLPPLSLLQSPDLTIQPTESKEELIANARLMQQTLAQFGIEVALGDITKGPTITRYELHPSPGIKLERITALTNNIAAALKAERIHILAPVPGKSSVGIEVPNSVKTKVIMRDLLESEEWTRAKARIPLALGKDVYGHPMIADLADMPHLLIAGSTGSGKSVCINCIIASL